MELVCSYVHASDVWNAVRTGNLRASMTRIAIQATCFVQPEVGVEARGDRNEAASQTYTASEVICKEPA